MKLTKNGETIEIASEKQADGFKANGWAEVRETRKRVQKPKEPRKED